MLDFDSRAVRAILRPPPVIKPPFPAWQWAPLDLIHDAFFYSKKEKKDPLRHLRGAPKEDTSVEPLWAPKSPLKLLGDSALSTIAGIAQIVAPKLEEVKTLLYHPKSMDFVSKAPTPKDKLLMLDFDAKMVQMKPKFFTMEELGGRRIWGVSPVQRTVTAALRYEQALSCLIGTTRVGGSADAQLQDHQRKEEMLLGQFKPRIP